MTVEEILKNVDILRPNVIEIGIKLMWLNQLESKICDRLNEFEILGSDEEGITPLQNMDPLNMQQGYEAKQKDITYDPYTTADTLREVVLSDRFAEIYVLYLKSKIDHAENETDSYINDTQMFEAEFEQFLKHLNEHYHARQPRWVGFID